MAGLSSAACSPLVFEHRVDDLAERTIVTTDRGQPHNPPVEDGLGLMADALHAAGFSDQEITTMIVSNSRLLAGPPPRKAS